MTHDRDVAFTILFDRLVGSEAGGRFAGNAVRQAAQAIIDGSFGGSRPAFTAALARGGANIYVARAAIADELLRVQVEAARDRRARLDRAADPGLLRHLL